MEYITTVYFVRHAQADNSNQDGRRRPLTEKGLADRRLVTEFLEDKAIDAVLSSPFKRAVDTVAEFAEKGGFEIEKIEDFRERKSDSDWDRINDGLSFIERQWADFSYKLSDGECLAEVQARNIRALNQVLALYKGKKIAIGTHGTALSTIINYYDSSYSFDNFMDMLYKTPWIVKMDFDENGCIGIEKIDLFESDKNHNKKSDYEQCEVRTAPLGYMKAYRYTVIFSRYKDKWLYCRAKARDGFETAGGRIELGETALEAAKRELFEETGAISFDITPAFDYSVHFPAVYSNGQVFLAEIHELGDMPDFEMSEIGLFDTIPDIMRFPNILPVLFNYLQGWMNLRTAADEIWDIYDSERRLTGRTHRRMDPLPPDDYHLVVDVWLQNSKGEFLITKRAPNKGFPNMWECQGGSAAAGDDSLSAAVREVKEETGLDLNPEKGRCVLSLKRKNALHDIWLFRQDFEIADIKLQEGETIDAKYAELDEIFEMISRGRFCPIDYMNELHEICDLGRDLARHFS